MASGQASRALPELTENIEVDVAIIGGGIAGIITAYELQKAGYSVAVVEQNKIAHGTTSGTTGKVSSQHGLLYTNLIKKFDHHTAQVYGGSYEQALRDIEHVI